MRHSGFIYVASTLDTKNEEAQFVRQLIESAGLPVRVVDLSTHHADAMFSADFSAKHIAAHHPDGESAVFCGDRGRAVSAMAEAFRRFLSKQNDVLALLGLGGSGGTALVTPAMQDLPIGIPKLMVSTMASGDVSGYVGASDIAMMYSVTDVSGLNRISRRILSNAAHQIAGAVYFANDDITSDKPAIGLTMFGVTTPCVQTVTAQLENDFDCLVFHATGSGGQAMEKLIDNGLLCGVLDLTTTEVCDHLFGGVLACTDDRFGAIIRQPVPCVMSCGALDMINFGSPDSVPAHYRDRLFYHHNAQVTLMRTTPEENTKMGRWIGQKLNQSAGKITFLIPLGGFSALDAPDSPFWSPSANQAFIDALLSTVNQTRDRQILTLPYHINDPAFAAAAANTFYTLIQNAEER